jgi:hypothetical protein
MSLIPDFKGIQYIKNTARLCLFEKNLEKYYKRFIDLRGIFVKNDMTRVPTETYVA